MSHTFTGAVNSNGWLYDKSLAVSHVTVERMRGLLLYSTLFGSSLEEPKRLVHNICENFCCLFSASTVFIVAGVVTIALQCVVKVNLCIRWKEIEKATVFHCAVKGSESRETASALDRQKQELHAICKASKQPLQVSRNLEISVQG